MTQLFTIGYAGHDRTSFVEVLKQHQVTAVADVRSMPKSSYWTDFDASVVKSWLKAQGIAYVYLGAELGARRQCAASYDGDRVVYTKVFDEDTFLHGIQRLQNGMEKFNIALMCAEKDPLVCHRTLLITRYLSTKMSIGHIGSDGVVETQEDLETRLMASHNVLPDLFRDRQTCLELAYQMQSQKHGHRQKDDAQ